MIAMPFDRRAATEFDDLLEGRIEESTPELTKLLAFAEQVWAVPTPQPREEFTSSLRARLMEAAPSALAQSASTPIADPAKVYEVAAARRRRQIAAAVAAFTVAGAATGTAFAAERSLPGETLYPIKRLVEKAHSTISLGDARRGNVEVSQAHKRLDEATQLAQDGDNGQAAVALEDFVDQAKQGAALLTEAGHPGDIHDFADTSLQQVSVLAALLPPELLTPVLTVVIAIDKAAAAAFPGAGDGLTELPNTLTQILSAASKAVGKPVPTDVPAPGAAALAEAAASEAASDPAPAGGATTPGTKPSSGATTTSKPTAQPSTIGGAVGGVGEAVGSGVVGGLGTTVDGLGEAVGGPVGGVVSGVGKVVTGLGQAVDDLLTGVGDALDGKPAQ